MNHEAFKAAVISAQDDESRIDELCIRRLKELAQDHGREGRTAIKLLDIVKDILEI